MKITVMTPAVCRQLRAKLEAALAPLEQDLGVSVTLGAGRYTTTSLVLKVEFKVTTESGMPADFGVLASLVGLPSDCWGAEVHMGSGERLRIDSIDLKKRTYPVYCTIMAGRRAGKTVRYRAEDISRALELKKLREQAAS